MAHLLTSLIVLALALAPQTSTLQRDIDRDEARKHYRAGERLMAREAFEGAVREYRTAAELDPDYVLAYYSSGQALMALRRYPEALEAFIDARDTIVHQSHLDLKGQAQAERNRRDEINDLEDSLQKVRSGKIGGYGTATMALETGIEQRLSLLHDAEQRGLGNEPQIPAELSLALGSAYYRQGQREEAEREYRSAIRRRGNLGEAHNNLAVVCMASGRFEEAGKEIHAAEEAGYRVSQLFKDELEEKETAAMETAAE